MAVEKVVVSVVLLYEALHRLIANDPLVVEQGSKINLDNVALEAGYKAGTIRRARDRYAEIVRSIELAAKEQEDRLANSPLVKMRKELESAKRDLHNCQQYLDRVVVENVMLARQNNELWNRISEIEKKLKLRLVK